MALKINSIQYHYYKPNFTSKVIAVPYGYADENLKNEVDIFEETHSNAKFLGQGLFAKAWLMQNGNLVIKESREEQEAKRANNGFLSEARNLAFVPKGTKGSQKLVANVVTQKGNSFLITTFVDGKNADAQNNHWKKEHFASILDTLFELDKAGVYHGDINEGNCMLCDDGRVNLLDYQWASKFNYWEKRRNDEVFRFPEFMLPSNAQMLEMANLSYYFANLGQILPKHQVRQTFKEYLQEKSSYCLKRAEFIEENYNDMQMADYEYLQSRFLKNPTDDIIDLQALKLQMFYAYRNSCSVADKNNSLNTNIMSSISYFLNAACCARKFANKAYEMRDSATDRNLIDYLNFEINLGQYWIKTILNDLSGDNNNYDNEAGLLKWILRNAKLSPKKQDGRINLGDDLSLKFKQSNQLDFGRVEDLSKNIIYNQKIQYRNSHIPHLDEIKNDFYMVDVLISRNGENRVPSSFENSIKFEKLKEHENEFVKSFNETFHAVNDEKILASFPCAIRALYNAMLYINDANEMSKSAFSANEKFYLEHQKNYISLCANKIEEVIYKLYDRILRGVKAYSHSLENTLYYEGLGEFNVGDCPEYDYHNSLIFKNDISY